MNVRRMLIKRFPLDLDWQHLNAYTQWTVAYIAFKHRVLLFILKQLLLLTCKGCRRPAIYKKNRKILKWGLFHFFHFLFVSISKLLKLENTILIFPQSHNNNHKNLTSTCSSCQRVGRQRLLRSFTTSTQLFFRFIIFGLIKESILTHMELQLR